MVNLIERETLFSKVIDFNLLTPKVGSLYTPKTTRYTDTSNASNSIGSGRVSLTSLAFGITTELFCMSQISKNLDPDEFILDLGCGEPALFSLMGNSMMFNNYVGVDVRSEPLLKYGNSKNCIVINDSAIDSDILKKSGFQVVVMSEVLEHLDKKSGDLLLVSAWEYLKPGGTLILTTPIKPMGQDIDMDIEKKKWDHITYYEGRELINKLSILGFTNVKGYFSKFLGRHTTYKTVRKGISSVYGETGEEIFDHLAEVFTPRIAASLLGHFADDLCGHIQIVATKR